MMSRQAMSLDVGRFSNEVAGETVSIVMSHEHRLVKLAQKLPWEDLLALVLPDLQCTEKKRWWVVSSLRVRIHLGVYIAQQMFDLTNRMAGQPVRDNAAFRMKSRLEAVFFYQTQHLNDEGSKNISKLL